jgi:CheY-like chemotaxis protein
MSEANARNRLLVVDDDPSTCEAMKTIFEIEGYEVTTAGDGAEALRTLSKGLRPSLILLDLRMPGMDGRAFRDEQARQGTFADIPVIVLSADRDAREIAERMGLIAVAKPIELGHLFALVKEYCGPGEHAAIG